MSLRTFNENLYREHLEEVACMAQMRVGWLSDGESTPDDIAGVEGRIEAHVDALCLGGQCALDVAHDTARPDDPWSLYAWVAVACRSEGHERLRGVFARLERFCALDDDELDPSTLQEAVADALIDHLPQSRVTVLARQLHLAPPSVAPALAQCIAVRCPERAEHEPAANLTARRRPSRVAQ